ncbi:MAG: MBOAT family O-acyltransferase, partial [Actinomycetes bacterium]
IGDALAANLVDRVFEAPERFSSLEVLLGVYGYAFQLYNDFSGYTDVARGSAKLFGYELPLNFDRPYLAPSLQDFWRRWPISLSSWLRDYLYIPLGGNRGSFAKTQRNLFLTMLLGGLWHGAAWTFVVWGALHGTALAVHRALGAYEARGRPPVPRVRDIPRILGTFTFVTALWVFFRAATLGDAIAYFRNMATGGLLGADPGPWKADLLLVGSIAALVLTMDLIDRRRAVLRPLTRWSPGVQGALLAAAAIGILVWAGQPPTPFIYFQF